MKSSRTVTSLFTGLALGLVGTLVAMGSASAEQSTTMSLSADGDGTIHLGSYITVAFNESTTIDGDYFDIWACPDQTVQPVDGGDSGSCTPLTFWERRLVAGFDQQTTARTMTWVVSNEATPGLTAKGGTSYLTDASETILVSPPDGADGWCTYAGQYLIVHDFDDTEGTHGGHSNWLQIASDCADLPTDDTTTSVTPPTSLPATGNSSAPLLVGLVALALGAGVVAVSRRRTA